MRASFEHPGGRLFLTVCVNHRSRSWARVGDEMRPLFRAAFDQLLLSLREIGVESEIVIVDWPEPDKAELGLGDWCKVDAPPEVRVVQGRGEFTRGGGRNHAAALARGNVLCFVNTRDLSWLGGLFLK